MPYKRARYKNTYKYIIKIYDTIMIAYTRALIIDASVAVGL